MILGGLKACLIIFFLYSAVGSSEHHRYFSSVTLKYFDDKITQWDVHTNKLIKVYDFAIFSTYFKSIHWSVMVAMRGTKGS